MKSSQPPSTLDIVFFDGYCGLCNNVVDHLLKLKDGKGLKFAPLQGNTAQELLTEQIRSLDTIVFRSEGRVYTQSQAVFKLAGIVKGKWILLFILWPLQPLIGDVVYRWVAKHRMRWFGKRESCRLPSPAEAARFLP